MDKELYLRRLGEINSNYNLERIGEAFDFATKAHEGQFRRSGEGYITHPAEVSLILASLDLDDDTIIAGLLHDVIEDTTYGYEGITKIFGKDVGEIVDGVTKIEKISYESKEVQQAENFRKMLLAMSQDLRVIIVKLADRLHNMRTLKFKSDESIKRTANETLEIYVPIAHRLGIFKLKWELEDLSFYYLQPEEYRDLAQRLDRKRAEREKGIQRIIEEIRELLEKEDLNCKIYGRPKNLYSIYKKMTLKDRAFEEIHDLTAIRVIVKEVAQCYAVLGLIHSKGKPIPGRFKDYIAMPKPNMYQSLHTTLLSENAETFEVQIRTEDMHRVAEYGIAAHWKYKQGQTALSGGSDLHWIDQLMEWQKEMDNPAEFINSVKMDLYNTHVYVFTPMGNVIELPDGSTPVDFAYKIHTDVGNHCVGAKVNSRIVPLNFRLKIGDIVEILTSKSSQGPSRDWLNFVQSSQAKNKIKNFYKKESQQENIDKGKEALEKNLRKFNLTLKDILVPKVVDILLDKLSLKNLDQLYAAVGYGGIGFRQILPTIKELLIPEEKTLHLGKTRSGGSLTGITVEGFDDLQVRFAKCCNPLPGDSIIGYITRGSGVTVHKSSCTNFSKGKDEMNRFIEVAWDDSLKTTHSASLKVIGRDRPGLLSDITSLIQNMQFTLTGVNARVNNEQLTRIVVSFDVKSADELKKVSDKLRTVPSVMEVHRL
ncbi:MAG: bifunctional (p)ppGpp synthetase/guanosine-3',5'-bis(diphosphate) 3'-pyrophosphohydrolase [Tissierellia bacterium]|nr:bifunctional (p)ppGpp synthetase/guanosine-3',5'-bis(diphosphate) 3'-pyrophosphohydrolase [Tissierellia bacterium]